MITSNDFLVSSKMNRMDAAFLVIHLDVFFIRILSWAVLEHVSFKVNTIESQSQHNLGAKSTQFRGKVNTI